MYHCSAWSASITAVVFTEIPPIADGIIPQSATPRLIPPTDMNVLAAAAMGTTLTRLRVTTPKLRQVSPIEIRPIMTSLVGVTNANICMYDRNPLDLRGQEEVIIEELHTAAGAERNTVLFFWGDNPTPLPPGDTLVVHATSTTAATANVWSQIAYTLDTALPAGRYAVVGLEHIATNGQAARLTFDGQFWRPGWPSIPALGSRLPDRWYTYPLGVMGQFNTFSLPRVEVLCNAADAAHDLYFHIIPIRFGLQA